MKNRNCLRRKNLVGKKFYCLAGIGIAISLGVSLMSNTLITYAAESKKSSEDIKNTSDQEYVVVKISCAKDLVRLSINCKLDEWSIDKKVILTEDIDVSGSGFEVIPIFSGLFEGAGYTISNIHGGTTGSQQGLFRYVAEGAIIQNLNVNGHIAPDGSKSQIGGITGVNDGTITNCTFNGTLKGENNIGGIAGVNQNSGVIEKCHTEGVISGKHTTGGIAGQNYGIIESCDNVSNINTSDIDESLDLENINFDINLDADQLNSTENTSMYTDTGGIAGYSEGVVKHCANNGTIGYEHVGYNTGGIVGRQNGYILECTNVGKVLGRKDVGGIIGQMEPFLIVNYSRDFFEKMDIQATAMNQLMDQLTRDTSTTSTQTTDSMDSINKKLSETQDIVDNQMDKEVKIDKITKPEVTLDKNNIQGSINSVKAAGESVEKQVNKGVTDVNEALKELKNTGTQVSNNMKDVNKQVESLTGNLSDSSRKITSDVDAISAQMDSIQSLISTTESELKKKAEDIQEDGLIEDVSELEAYTSIQGKVSDCTNEGTINADVNVGGIVGEIGVEYDFDLEEDMNTQGSTSTNFESKGKAVVLECKNNGSITAKKDYTGGIVGEAQMGVILFCEAYGDVTSEEGDYVGGVAGGCQNIIRNCYTMCNLKGKNYMGGIAGEVKDVSTCYSMTRFDSDGECIGAIAGNVYGESEENYFVKEKIGGIDNISYAGSAIPVTYQKFIETEGLPKDFTELKLKFVVDGKVIETKNIQYGDSLTEDELPLIPEKEGYYSNWPDIDYDKLIRSEYLEAEYTPYVSALSSEEKTAGGLSIILVEGQFEPSVYLTLEATDHQKPAVTEEEQLEGMWKIHLTTDKQGMIDKIPQEELLIHLWTNNEKGIPKVLVNEPGADSWQEVSYQMDGNYAVFKGIQDSDIVLIYTDDTGKMKLYVSIGCLVGGLLLLIVVGKAIKKLKKKSKIMKKMKEETK